MFLDRDRYLLIPVNPWHVLYSNPDIALCGPDLCSPVMWLRVMIRDRIFFFLRSARIPCAFEKEGGRGGNCRAEGSLSKRLGVGENDEELDRKSADRRSVSRAIIPRTSGGFAGEIFHWNVWERDGKIRRIDGNLGYKVWLVSLYIDVKWFANYLKTI